MSKRPSALGQRSEQSDTQYASLPSLLIAGSRAPADAPGGIER